jgi:hypothetical protein
VALIHYYKFNGNLYDSIGAFDLLADINSPVYVPGKLGGSTGAVTSSSASFYRFGCTGTGAAASGFMAADTTEAANGVLSWSMTGWVYLTSFSTQLIQLLTGTAGQSTATLVYDQKYGTITFNGTSAACSSATWVFFAIRVTGGASYLSVNGGAESMNTWTTNMMAGGKSLFNGIRIGSPSAFASLYAYLDDVRVFNHSLSSGEIAGIYNAGLPAEATAATATWDQPIHHYKFTNNLNDTTGSVSAAFIPALGTGSYVSGLFTNSPNAVRVTQSSGVIATQPSQNWAGSTGWTVSYWLAFNSVSMAGGYVTYIFHDAFSQYFAHKFDSAGSYYEFYNGSSTIQISDSYFSGHKIIKYDAIAYRVTFYTSASGGPRIIAQMNAGTFLNTFQAQCPVAGTGDTFTLDDLRIYNKPLIGGVDYDLIYNGGSGTEYSVVTTNGSATGAGATVTMTAPAGAATVPTNGSATGAGVTVTMTAPAGTASSVTNGSATGTGRTITMAAPAGLARTSWITEPIPTVTMVPPEGRVRIGAETIGPTILVTIPPAGLGAGGGSASGVGRTVTVSAPAGSASGRAASAGTIGTVALSPAAGSATGSAPASGAPGTVAVTALAGGATGTATKAAGLATVTVTTTAGSAIGTAAAGGALSTIAVSTTAGSAGGTAAATGAGRTVAVSAPAGTLTASATTAGSLATITVAAPTATRTGGATASPAGVTVTVAAPAGGSIGTATGTGAISTATMTAPGGAARVSVSAAGSLPTVTSAAAAGAATGTASATGGGAAVTMTAPAGVARASVVATGAPGTVTMTATAGSAAGTLTAPLATITMVAPTGTALAIVRGIGALGTVTMTAPGAGTITASATGNPSGVTVSVIAPAARVAPITTGGGTSVSTYDLRRAGTNL